MKIVHLLMIALALGMGMGAKAQTFTPASVEGPGSTLSQNPRPKIDHSPHLPYGLQLMARFDLLPTLRDTKCVQDSSYDRTGGNGDSNHYFRREGNKAVLSDIRGPGCIYRFWSANAAGQLRIYFDGETKPTIDCPMQDLFLGKVAPFVQPIVGHESGGWYCFFPMPFQKSCRIEVTDPGSLYYHVQYQLFPDGTPIRTFTRDLTPEDQRALDTIVDQWAHLGADPNPPSDNISDASGKISLAPGATRTLATLIGPAEIRRFSVKITPADRYTLRQTLARVYWDDAKTPGIEAPIGDFFGVGFGDQRYAALPSAMTDDGYVCYWPMPFARSARIELVNTGSTPIKEIRWTARTLPLKKPLTDVGYFHAQWHRETTVAGKPFQILKVSGRGQYVGEHTDMQGDRGIGFLEGDEKILVDAETFPSIYGTGTEDFYTGGWYFDEGPFNLAYHGCMIKEERMSRVAAYRYQIQDCVPFQKDISVTIEHGGMNDYPGADYDCVAYWYQMAPDHNWSPVDVAQLTPSHMKIAGAMEAEDLRWTEGKADIQDDRNLQAEASGGKVVTLGPGLHTFAFDVKDDDVYIISLCQPVAPGSARLGSRWWLDDQKLDDDVLKGIPDAGALLPGEHSTTSTALHLKPGPHTATISIAAGKLSYLDYVSLTPSRKVPGVIEAESLLDKAVTNGKDSLTRDDVSYNWSGLSALIWKPTAPGATLKLPITLPADADYTLDLAVTPQPNGPQIDARLDDLPIAGTIDTYAATLDPNKVSVPMSAGRFVNMKAGPHTLTLIFHGQNKEVKAPELWLDYLRLHKSLYPNTVEAEDLKVLGATDGEATHQAMAGFGPNWSNDDQFWFLGQKEGAEASLELPVAQAGKYELSAYYTTSRDYAIVQVLLDGQPLGPPTDTYSAPVLAKGKTTLGVLDLAAGAHRITFRAVGKNPASTGYLIGVDAIGLTPK